MTRAVAILVFDGVYLLDFAGPMEVFTDACTVAGKPLFTTALVAVADRTVRAHTGLVFQADHDLATCPVPDLLVVPGGQSGLAREVPALASWLRRIVPRAEHTLAVCTGSFLLGDAGLLEGLCATTWHGALARFAAAFPETRLVTDRRVVDNGRIVTTAGVSAGIDGALHLVARLHGPDLAAQTAAHFEWPLALDPGGVGTT